MNLRSVSGVLRAKCPRCYGGNLFVNTNPYHLSGWDKMHSQCKNCGQKFELEPGFYQGAMYVSYALAVAWSVGVFLVFWLGIGFTPLSYFIGNALSLVAIAPLIFRWSRALYLYFFIKHKGDKPA